MSHKNSLDNESNELIYILTKQRLFKILSHIYNNHQQTTHPISKANIFKRKIHTNTY